MISKDIIEQILSEYKGENIAEHLYTKLKLVETIESSIKDLKTLIEDEEAKYEKRIKEIKTCIKDWQETCKHWSKTFHPDPSGNNDSFHECNICGKEL